VNEKRSRFFLDFQLLNINISDKQLVNRLDSSGMVLCGLYYWGDARYKLIIINKTTAAANNYFKVRIVANFI